VELAEQYKNLSCDRETTDGLPKENVGGALKERNRKGRPRVTPAEEKKRFDIWDKWKRAQDTVTEAKFCQDEKIDPKYLQKIRDWAGRRKKRDTKKKGNR